MKTIFYRLLIFVLFLYTHCSLQAQSGAPTGMNKSMDEQSHDYLDINNIRARFNVAGLHFFRDSAEFEVPKGSGKCSIFANGLWIGGYDNENTLHVAGVQYGQGSGAVAFTHTDFWAGPVSSPEGYNKTQDSLWNRIWKIKRPEIEYHRNHFWEPGYTIPKDILEWPAHGEVSLGQAANLAPFSDRNGNGIYEPQDGDYPEIRGDEALFFIFNDDHGWHSETNGNKFRIEVHGMAYAFDCPGDTAFKNTVFLHYKIVNRSQNTYNNTWLGVFTDLDLGYSRDDFIACDVQRGMYYAYNGRKVDGTGQPGTYGEFPPAQGVIILGGPLLDADQSDNPSFKGSAIKGPSFGGSCDIISLDGDTILMNYGQGGTLQDHFLVRSEAVNGLNFGDGIVDNERMGMAKMVIPTDNIPGFPSYGENYPQDASDYYECMQGIWPDGSMRVYGGNAHPNAGGYGPVCRFTFPGLSDSCLWGTRGALPNSQVEWNEKTAGNVPGDRRATGSCGPFTFLPGATEELDIAFTWARDINPADSSLSVNKLMQAADSVRQAFAGNRSPCGGVIYGIEKLTGIPVNSPEVYPNPVHNNLYIDWRTVYIENASFRVMTMEGKTLLYIEKRVEGQTTLDLSGICPGFYILIIRSNETTRSVKVIKY